MSRTIYMSMVVLLLVCTGCSSQGSARNSGCSKGGPSKYGPSCLYLTEQATRGVSWQAYCDKEPDCTRAAETGLFTRLGPVSGADYASLGHETLICAEVTFTRKDGSELIRRFVVVDSVDRMSFEIIEEVEVESCVNMSS